MSEAALNSPEASSLVTPGHGPAERSLRRRHRNERLFRAAGVSAIALAMSALALLLLGIAYRGWPAFSEPVIELTIGLDREVLNPVGRPLEEALREANYATLITRALLREFPDAVGRNDKRQLKRLVSSGAGFELMELLLRNPEWVGSERRFVLPLADPAAQWMKARGERVAASGLSEQQSEWLAHLRERGVASTRFNSSFLTSGDSREPELAGLWGAAVGSVLTLIVTLAFCFPIGVGAAIYLEEFATRGRLSDFLEVNINNLAAVPSVVFGLLGLAIFLGFFALPRSAPVVGGLVLSLMTLPTIIIAARTALAAVPPSIREAALAIGASPVQVVFHHLLPLATPGIMTGTIVGMARALGETAPLLMIGMVAFVADIPTGLESPATVLPVQIYIWSDSPQRGFEEKTAGAILVLLSFLVLMNAAAILVRRKFETRW